MKIKQILRESSVESNLKADSKEGVIEELASLLLQGQAAPQPEFREKLVRVLMEREKLGSTGIGNGVAIPHGKMPGLGEIMTGFGRSPKGIEFDSQDGRSAHLFFILVAPENAASLHLKALARLSRLLKDAHFRNKLMEAESAHALYQAIVEEDEKF
ncbi:MAG: PTS sugar transporter subunit IIA [Deltaproteobacteria bacterium]|nr:PTS sugar transporter subunit IIA [Deltaproteobacteria bacterium]